MHFSGGMDFHFHICECLLGDFPGFKLLLRMSRRYVIAVWDPGGCLRSVVFSSTVCGFLPSVTFLGGFQLLSCVLFTRALSLSYPSPLLIYISKPTKQFLLVSSPKKFPRNIVYDIFRSTGLKQLTFLYGTFIMRMNIQVSLQFFCAIK